MFQMLINVWQLIVLFNKPLTGGRDSHSGHTYVENGICCKGKRTSLVNHSFSISSNAPFSETTAFVALTNISYQLAHINCHISYTSLGRQHHSNFWLIVNLKMGLLLSCLNNYLTAGEVSDE